MVYQIRSTKQKYLYGSLMKTDGSIRTLSAQELSVALNDDYHLTQGKYPRSFTISIPDEQIAITVYVVNENLIMRFGIEYFEGMVTFSGSHQGEGFLEMTGYN
jgi:predicted secreted hydrolase